MDAIELMGRLKNKLIDPVDTAGVPIDELAGCKLKAMEIEDLIAAADYTKSHGTHKAYQIAFVRCVVNPDGTRILSDDDAPKVGVDQMGGPIERAVLKIRSLGRAAGEDDEKKESTRSPEKPS